MAGRKNANKNTPEVREQNKKAGALLRKLREQAGYHVQQDFRRAVGYSDDNWSAISQIETGNIRIPPEMYRTFARALSMDVDDFSRRFLRIYNPVMFDALYGKK